VGQTHIWVCRWEVSRRYYCGGSLFFFFLAHLILKLVPFRTSGPARAAL
jgi:hypothetical protein